MKKSSVLAFAVLALATRLASAYDPSPLQDFCVGVDEPKYGLFVNGKFCKDPNLVVADDFYTSGLDVPASTDNADGYNVTGINVERLPGLNHYGLVISSLRLRTLPDKPASRKPSCQRNHNRGNGQTLRGFYALFVLPRKKPPVLESYEERRYVCVPNGMPRFQMNIENTPAVALSAFNGQDPGKVPLPVALFGSFPSIRPEVLARSLRLDRKVNEYLQAQFQNSTSP